MVNVIITNVSIIILTLWFSLSLLHSFTKSLPISRRDMVSDHTTWMLDDLDFIRHLPLNKVAIPGSHNSGSYAIGPRCNQPAGDCPRSLGRYSHLPLVSRIITRWAKCQKLSIYEQLIGGIRYFDVRLSFDSGSKHIYLCHGLRCITLPEFTAQILEFIENYPSELVILDVNHVYVDFKHSTRCPNDQEHVYIIDCLLLLLGSHVIQRDYQPCSTIESLLASGKRIVLIYDHDEIAIFKNIWDRHSIYSHWSNSSNIKHIKSDGINQILQRNSSKLHVLQLLISLSLSEIASRLASSIIKHSKKLCSTAPEFILEQCSSSLQLLEHFNIVIIDDCGYNEHAIVAATREINKCKFSSLSANA